MRHNAGRHSHQRQWIAAIQRQFRDRSLFHDLPEGICFRLEQGRFGLHLDDLVHRPHFHREVHLQSAFHLHQDGLTNDLLESALFCLDLIFARQNVHERVVAGSIGRHVVFFISIHID